jgi:hypothetical protein
LRKSLRTSDYAFRIGGDEFALLLVQSDREQATILANRVRANFAVATQPLQMSAALGLDYGLAVYPEDGEQKEILLRIADEHLYEMKNTQRQPGAVASHLPPAPRPVTPAASVLGQRMAGKGSAGPAAQPAAKRVEQRKWERVQLVGTRAYAQFTSASQTARVLDLGYGGVGLELNPTNELPATFEAVLHVPILPPVRVTLKIVYQVRTESGNTRLGCSFVT